MSWGTHAAASSTAPTPRGERTRPARFRSAPAQPVRRLTTRPAHPRGQYSGWRAATAVRTVRQWVGALHRPVMQGEAHRLVATRGLVAAGPLHAVGPRSRAVSPVSPEQI